MKNTKKNIRSIFIFLLFLNIASSIIYSLLSYFSAQRFDKTLEIINSLNHEEFKVIIYISIILLILGIFILPIEWLRHSLNAKMQFLFHKGLVQDIFNSVEHNNFYNPKTFDSSEIYSKISNDGPIYLENKYFSIIEIASIATNILISILLGSLFSWYIPLFLIILLIVSYLLSLTMIKKQKRQLKDYSDKFEIMMMKVKNIIEGYDRFYYSNKNYMINIQLNKIISETFESDYKKNQTSFVIDFINREMINIIEKAMIFTLAFLILKNQASISALFLAIALFTNLTKSLPELIQNIKKIKIAKVSLSKLLIKKDIDDSIRIKTFESLELKNFSFNYDDKEIFKNFNYSFKKGKKYALIGASGSGKSTLVDCILGINKNYQGSLKINDIEIRDLNKNDLKNIFTFQNSNNFLFDESLNDNIALWDENFSQTKIDESLKEANIYSEIHKHHNLDDDNLINSLSLGQKQRISLSRSFYNLNNFLILDESFSNLDNKNAHEIQEKLFNKPDLTLINITHHLTKENQIYFDEIINLDDVSKK